MPPKKKGGKRKGKGRRTTGEPTTPDALVMMRLERKLVKVSRDFISTQTEDHRLMMENASLKQEIRQVRMDRKGYFEAWKRRIDQMQLEVEERKRRAMERARKIERQKEDTLAELRSNLQNTCTEIEDRKTQEIIIKRKLVDMNTYEETESKQMELVVVLSDQLDALREQHQADMTKFKTKIVLEEESWKRLLKRDIKILCAEMARKVHGIMVLELKKVNDTCTVLYSKFLAILKHKRVLESRRYQLQKKLESLEREEQYWSDIKCIRKKRPFRQVKRQSTSFSIPDTQLSNKESTTTTEEDIKIKKSGVMPEHHRASYGAIMQESSSILM